MGIRYAVENYTDVPIKVFPFEGERWRIYDREVDGAMMITPSLATVRKAGAATGISFGIIPQGWDSDQEFRAAAVAYLGRRGCKIASGRLVLRSQYEYDYTCAAQ